VGKLVFIALLAALAYAWYQGMLDPYLPGKPQRYDQEKRYGGADVPRHEQCAQARAKLRELEMWAEKNVRNPELEQTRQFVAERCQGY
jgi:hypothetical protein